MFQYQRDGKLSGRGRVFGGGFLSIAVHGLGGVAALYISQIVPSAPPKAMKSALTYMAAVAIPVIPDEPAMVDLAVLDLPRVQPVEVRLAPAPEPAAQPLPEIARAAVPVPMATVVPPVVQPRLAEPPPSKEVTVGTFAAVGAKAPTSPVRTVADSGFGQAVSVSAGPAGPALRTVADAGFGAVVVGAKATTPPRTVTDTGFGTAGLGANQTRPALREVKQTGFSDTQPAAAATKAAPPERVEVPLEVISKPNPAYTAEARAMKLEGEVSLEVEFCASGSVRVLRVVRGLGHGLDEAAVKAAERITFKPAQSQGRAVDVRTTVHISFRLS